MQLIWAFIMFFMVDEPIVMDAKEARRAGRKSFCGKIWSLMKQVYKANKADHSLFIGIILSAFARIVVMLQQITYPQWCRSYIGTVYAKDTEARVWQAQYLIANFCAVPMILVTGRLSDRLPAKMTVPATVCFQLIIMTLYLFVDDPTSWECYILSVFLAGSGFAVSVSMLSYLMKRIPKMVRGMMIAVISVASCVGSVIYLNLYSLLLDKWKAADYPDGYQHATFLSVIWIDLLVLAILAVVIPLGWYGMNEGGHGGEEEPKELGYMDDAQVPDLPKNQDLEVIEEQDELETSLDSFAGLKNPFARASKGDKEWDAFVDRKPSRYRKASNAHGTRASLRKDSLHGIEKIDEERSDYDSNDENEEHKILIMES